MTRIHSQTIKHSSRGGRLGTRTVCVRTLLIQGFAEENVGPIEGYRAAADDGTSCHRPPKNICTGEFPNCQQRGQHCHQNARARYPEGDTSHQAWVEKAAWLALFRVCQIFCSARLGATNLFLL